MYACPHLVPVSALCLYENIDAYSEQSGMMATIFDALL